MKVIIYKITNKINKKWYIGKTDRTLEIRWREHLSDFKNKFNLNRKLHLSMRKYGVENFTIEEVKRVFQDEWKEEEINMILSLGGYENPASMNSSPGGEGFGSGEDSIVALLKNSEVLEIRKRRFNGESKKEVFKDYSDKITFNGFESVWLENGYLNIGTQYFLNKEKSELISLANRGSKNGRAKLTEEIVFEIRKKKKEGFSKSEIQNQHLYIPKSTFNKVWNYYTWKHVKID